MPPRRDPLLLLGLAGQYPLAGVAWQAIQYLLGLRALGWDVFYVEDSGAWPYDPRAETFTGDRSYAVGYLARVMRRVGFEDRWAYVDLEHGETYGLPRSRLDRLYREAAGILNLCGVTRPREEHRRGARLILVETDPGTEQFRIAAGDRDSLAYVTSHDVLFTYGENLGAPDCPVPLAGLAWRKTRPPVVLERWERSCDPAAAAFTTVMTFRNTGKDVTAGGETYRWSKDERFLRMIDLPRRTGLSFRLATDPCDAAIEARLRAAGWDLRDPRPLSADIDLYRDFIWASRGEFTVAKDLYVRLRTGWFSDRSACYLAAGKPVVSEDTGFGKFVPAGAGLFAFSSADEAASALARIDADYPAQCAAARRIAAEHFGAGPVLRRLLAEAGLG